MTRLVVLRIAIWAIPLALAYSLVILRRRVNSIVAAVVLALSWNVWAVLAINVVALHFGWWTFHPDAPSFMGVAVEPWLGWVLLWAAVPLVALDRPGVVAVVAVAWADLLVMPLLEPLVMLRPGWLIGEGLALLIGFIPGLLLVRWTIARTHLVARLALQIGCSAGIFFWLVPSILFDHYGGWASVLDLPRWRLALIVQLVGLCAVVGVRAAIEFAERGEGTPLPYDPPKRLVTSGPYSYVRNPMQVSMVLALITGGVALWNAWLVAAGVVAFAYGGGLGAWHEDVQLSQRFGDRWIAYKASVRRWLPSIRPAATPKAMLLVAYSCGTCSSIGRWFLTRHPVGLTIAPAEEARDPELRRVTYLAAGAAPKRGVIAIARALEHIHLGWAFVGWLLAMPVISHFAQLIADVFGPVPHSVAGLAYDETACSLEASSRLARKRGAQSVRVTP